MRLKLYYSFLIALSFIIVSCATYKTRYSKEVKQWNTSTLPPREPKHTMYLLGDAGKPTLNGTTPVLKYLRPQLEAQSKNSSVLFLGDNIYEYGMPPAEDAEARAQAEININAQLEILNNYQGRPIFVPGNHDWRGWGLKGLKEQEKYIETYLNKRKGKEDKDDWENYFLPDDGCSGPSVVELNDDVVVIVVDSEWWLADWDKEPKINEGCEARNRATFKFIFENVVRKYRNKNVVIAMHHPIYTYGPHGGGFSVKQHLFPLTDINSKLYVPLPGVGTLGALYRTNIGSKQDLAHPDYRAFRASVMAAVRKNGNFIFASGHEHALEYIENEGQHFIVSGSGSKKSPLRLGKGAEFVSGNAGYNKLLFYEGGETWTQFWEVNADGTDAHLVYQRKIKDAAPAESEQVQADFTEYNQHKDTVMKPVTSTEVKPIGKGHKFLFGEHHRDLYLNEYPFPVLDLSAFKGGVTPIKQGGGNQTNSLRVRDSLGRDFVLRGMTKDVSRFLPFPFNKMTAAQYIVEDNFLSTLPFAPLAIPTLADAAGVYHTNPKLYYVPAQPALGTFNPLFGGTMCLVEERPSGKKWKDAAFFGNAKEIISTPELVENLLKSNDYKVDEEWAARTRLFDLMIGDWDRHDDQWTWARMESKDKDEKIFRPIPRDRDQAFSKYDGFLSDVARQTMPFLRQLQVYGPEMPNMKWTTWSARLFDRTFLNELSWEQWEAQAKYIQEHLTDADIERAFTNWPAKAQEITAAGVIKGIKARRDNLLKIARTHYEFLGESVDVIGTDERERFEVNRLDDEHTKVTVYELSKKGNVKRTVYERTFDHAITKKINLYGNGDDDEFIVKGDVKRSTTVRMIGGLGKDEFTDSSVVRRGARRTIIYDDLRNNKVTAGPETRDNRTAVYGYNIYDRRGYDSEYDIVLPLPLLGFNPDDGLLMGFGFNKTNYSFKKEPYASVQQFNGSYAFRTRGFKLNYQGDFINTFGKMDFFLNTHYNGPTYAFNFASVGNNSVRTEKNPNYYRVRQNDFRIYPAIKKRFAGNSGYVTLGPVFETNSIQDTPGRFIDAYGAGEEGIFDRKYYGGAELGLNYTNVDNFFAPHRGIRFNSTFDYTANLKEDSKQFTSWRAQFSFYRHIDRKENIIFASQVGTGMNFGKGYEFFQMPTIGGQLGLRAYRFQRFYGKSMFFQSTDVRVRLLSSYNPTLPLTLGVTASFDYGRVWEENDPSDNWHYSYGGSVWVAPVDALVLSLGVFIPKESFEESPRMVFKLGFGF